MRNRILTFFISLAVIVQSCIFVVTDKKKETTDTVKTPDTLKTTDSLKALHPQPDSDSTTFKDTADNQLHLPKGAIDTRNVPPQQILDFAKTLIGIPYKYGSTDPAIGFDCSGFITYVFRHFNIIVPRSSIDFTNVGKEVSVVDAKPGDLILFTGTDSTEHFVGHMGIVVENLNGQLNFIHSTSGKKWGVTITPFNDYYKGRYVKTIRIFPQNGLG